MIEDQIFKSIAKWHPFYDVEGALSIKYAHYIYNMFRANAVSNPLKVEATLQMIYDNRALTLTSPNSFIRTLAELLKE